MTVIETIGVAEPAGNPPAPGMIWIPGGTFQMGSDGHYPEEAPVHTVSVDGFWIDRTTVTNRQFGRFVAKTGYVTEAERSPDPADYPVPGRSCSCPRRPSSSHRHTAST